MSTVTTNLTFRIFKGDTLQREETLGLGVIKIGKVPSAHLRLDDEGASRMHAIIEVRRDGVAHIVDLGSTRGTMLNGVKVTKAALHSGDVLQFADTRIELAIAHATPAGFLDEQVSTPGAGAIEVAAILGDSVVGVKHCIDPKAGTLSATTKAMYGIAAACFALGATDFVLAVNNAADNAAAQSTWVNTQHRPAKMFRANLLGSGHDVAALGGLAGSLVTLVVALRRSTREQASPWARIGTAPGVEFPTAEAPSADFPLVAPLGDDFVMNIGAGMTGEMTVNGQSTNLVDLVGLGRARRSSMVADAIEVPLPATARVRVQAGRATFLISSVAAPRAGAFAGGSWLESRTMTFLAASAIVHLGVLAMLGTIGDESTTANGSLTDSPDLIVRTSSHDQDDPNPEAKQPEDGADGREEGTHTAAAMGLSGEMGKQDAPAKAKLFQLKRTADEEQLARREALQQAQRSGILGAAALADGGMFAAITGGADMSSGMDALDTRGGLSGTAYGESDGGFGNGLTGFGPGGDGLGTIGLCTRGHCAYGTIGPGKGHFGDGYALHTGIGSDGHRDSKVPPVTFCASGGCTVGPGYSKEIIKRYMKRNAAKFSYCYEKALLATPGLAGTVSAHFFISPSGTVQNAGASGLDPQVAACVIEVIKNISFPAPGDGAGVEVGTYPFNFRPAGS